MTIPLLSILLLLAPAAPGPVLKQAPPVCKDADEFLSKGLYEKAQKAYAQILLDHPGAPCAANGNVKLDAQWAKAKQHYDYGRKLEKTKVLDRARAAYAQALAIDPRFGDAALALVRLGNFDEDDPYREALAYSRAGLDGEALVAFKSAVKARDDIPEDLRYLVADNVPWWRDLKRLLIRYRWPIGEMLATAVILVCVIWYFIVLARGTPRIDVRPLTDDTVPTKVGLNVATMVRHHFTQLSTAHRPRLGTFVAPEQVFDTIKDITAAVPPAFSWLNAVPAALARLSPRRTFTMSGDLVPAGEFGKGLALVLTRGPSVIATATLWQKEFNPSAKAADAGDPTGYYILAEPAAVWLLFHVSGEVYE